MTSPTQSIPGAWYALALSGDIGPGTSAGTRLFGHELVVWRDAAGAAHVWEDRCPHRGMRLSFGFVRGDRIACLYHGWQFGTQGRCLHIPAHPDLSVPETIGVQRFAGCEQLGVIWVAWPAGDALPPSFAASAADPALPVRSLYVDRSAVDVTAYLMQHPAPSFGATEKANGHSVWQKQTTMLVATISANGAPATLHAAVQPISAAESAVHMTLAGDATACRGAVQVHVARWAERVRFDLEADLPSGRTISGTWG